MYDNSFFTASLKCSKVG